MDGCAWELFQAVGGFKAIFVFLATWGCYVFLRTNGFGYAVSWGATITAFSTAIWLIQRKTLTQEKQEYEMMGYATQTHRDEVHDHMARRLGFKNRDKLAKAVGKATGIKYYDSALQFEQDCRQYSSAKGIQWELLDASLTDGEPLPLLNKLLGAGALIACLFTIDYFFPAPPATLLGEKNRSRTANTNAANDSQAASSDEATNPASETNGQNPGQDPVASSVGTMAVDQGTPLESTTDSAANGVTEIVVVTEEQSWTGYIYSTKNSRDRERVSVNWKLMSDHSVQGTMEIPSLNNTRLKLQGNLLGEEVSFTADEILSGGNQFVVPCEFRGLRENDSIKGEWRIDIEGTPTGSRFLLNLKASKAVPAQPD
ncbi:MAG: hypothetical protein P8M30_13190 [Planctomycetaceae bacterium]|nr:hypothetical protein [Planctomycetaceae bacterium]